MRQFFTLFFILGWFDSGSQDFHIAIEDLSMDTCVVDTCISNQQTLDYIEFLEYKVDEHNEFIDDIQLRGDTLYIYKGRIMRQLGCALINCRVEHWDIYYFREVYLVDLKYLRSDYPQIKRKGNNYYKVW